MRDYPNGGVFFIDAAPIQAAGEDGLKIDGIFEDAKRAVKSGKVFVLSGLTLSSATMSGVIASAALGDDVIEGGNTELQIMLQITDEDVILINIGG